jgi:carboxylesterase
LPPDTGRAKQQAIGVLLLHGFTGNPHSLASIELALRELGLPVANPTLRGHGAASAEALRGLGWHDWLADAEAALRGLLLEARRVIVLGHSMGALLALNLAADHPAAIDSLILSATPILLASPLAPGRPFHWMAAPLQRVLRGWPIPKRYDDPSQLASDTSYRWAPTDALISFLHLTTHTRRRLNQVSVPALILQSRADQVVPAASAAILQAELGTPASARTMVWFERSRHELFRDSERSAVIAAVLGFVQERRRRAAPLRPCLLSGGESRRMGTDKAVLPHPEGGTWLERTLRLLQSLGEPVTLLSRHPEHLEVATRLSAAAVAEPPPWEGPLTALGRLMDLHPGATLLIAPVDMPGLRPESLRALLQAGPGPGSGILTAHDGQREQPLLGLYPATAANRMALESYTSAGGRSLLGWLELVGHGSVRLPAEELRNLNRPGVGIG